MSPDTETRSSMIQFTFATGKMIEDLTRVAISADVQAERVFAANRVLNDFAAQLARIKKVLLDGNSEG